MRALDAALLVGGGPGQPLPAGADPAVHRSARRRLAELASLAADHRPAGARRPAQARPRG